MIQWTERRDFTYKTPQDFPPPPVPPRSSWTATGEDGAQLEAFRWGSALARELFVLELRRHGAPRCSRVRAAHGPGIIDADSPCPCCGRSWPAHGDDAAAAEAPRLEELQAALDQLVPRGTVLALVLMSQGPDATYPSGADYTAVRVMQMPADAAPRARSPLVVGGRA